MKNTLILPALLLLLCTFSYSAFAQYDNYKLKDYVNPEYKRQSLDFNFNGTMGNTSTIQDQSGNYSYKTENKAMNLNSGLSLDYNRVKNSIRIQNTTDIGFSVGGYYSKNDYSNKNDYSGTQTESKYLSKSGTYNINLSFTHTGRYYGNNKNFLLFAPSAGFSYNHFKEKLDDESDQSFNSTKGTFATNASFAIGVGKGRIEEVGDARQAVYILQDLQKQGVLKKDLSSEEINELAQLITKVKYKRQFDSRIRLIQEITSIDSLFVEKGYVENDHSATYFTSLYDNWQFANVNRKAGNRFTVSVMPNLYYGNDRREIVYFNQNDYTVQDSIKRFDYGVALLAMYESEKPINLYWQRRTSLGYSIEWAGMDYPQHGDSYRTALTGDYGLTFYPNSRTSIGGYISQSLVYGFKDRWIYSITSLHFDMAYYFSPQFRLNISYRLGYDYRHTEDKDNERIYTYKNKYPNNYLSVNLLYSIF